MVILAQGGEKNELSTWVGREVTKPFNPDEPGTMRTCQKEKNGASCHLLNSNLIRHQISTAEEPIEKCDMG